MNFVSYMSRLCEWSRAKVMWLVDPVTIILQLQRLVVEEVLDHIIQNKEDFALQEKINCCYTYGGKEV